MICWTVPVFAASATARPAASDHTAILAACRRLTLAGNGGMELGDAGFVEVLVIELEFGLAVGIAKSHGADRPLRHHIAADERAFGAVHFEAGFGIFGGEAIMEQGDESRLEPHDAHDRILKPRLGQARFSARRQWPRPDHRQARNAAYPCHAR